ncbi:Z1 domain-containing protein [Candidatus Neomarinimicrobiota bacterium]
MNTATFLAGKSFIQDLLALEEQPTMHRVRELVNELCDGMPRFQNIDREYLTSVIEQEHILDYDDTDYILVSKDHAPWLYPSGQPIDTERKEIEWTFWENYKNLLRRKGFPPRAVTKIDSKTNEILSYLEDPMRSGGWHIKGMVVGDVQSGKTANYIGLISKAVDAGYRFIIVCAGSHNDLRSQTQYRIDEGFVGIDTRRDLIHAIRIGVGELGDKQPNVISLTSSREDGDFSRSHASKVIVSNLRDNKSPIILVVKKNKSVFDNLASWLKTHTTREVISGVPLLLIDDECDYASINTRKSDFDAKGNPIIKEGDEPTAINRSIRYLLRLFNSGCYVGYTATPYANILIHRDGFHPLYGDDLFPDHFIINIPGASNYISAKYYFGLETESKELPLARIVNDHRDILPDKHKKTLEVEDLPGSLKRALRSFLLVCAERSLRNQSFRHNSMLIHVTRFVDVQEQIAGLIQDELDLIRNRVRYDEANSIRELWENDFIPTTKQFLSSSDISAGLILPDSTHTWKQIKPELVKCFDKILVKQVNGRASDILDYQTYADTGINFIAIGGEKLSRGLTLEDLSVSYYLRVAKTYDTLMQMGRWFGYRSEFLDLCRIYTTYTLIDYYRHIAEVTEELRLEFQLMVDHKLEPKDYGMKIRSHPGILSVTSLGKRRTAVEMPVTFKGYTVQTFYIHTNQHICEQNYDSTNKLLESYNCEKVSEGYLVRDVSPSKIINFLSAYITHPGNKKCNPSLIADYIGTMNSHDQLTHWTVAIISIGRSKQLSQVSYSAIPEKIGISQRTPDRMEDGVVHFKKTILARSHESIDLESSLRERLERNDASPIEIKNERDRKYGLLIIYHLYNLNGLFYGNDHFPVLGYVISFPGRKASDTTTRFLFDHLAQQQQLGFFE